MGRKLKNEALLQEVEARRAVFQLYPKAGNQLDFESIYGNSNAVVLEIGIGRGEFLLSRSLLDWQHNYLGIDIDKDRINYTLRQLNPDRHSNVRILDLYVDENVEQVISEGSIKKVYIIHPDPWPKRRHNQRRLIKHKFIDVLAVILEDGGVVEVQTDHQEYAAVISRIFSEREDFIPVYGGVSKIPRHGHIVTYFEEKKMREGRYPVYITYKKAKKKCREV
jgi:tRNA (guanine-N7-)-methyltransferase